MSVESNRPGPPSSVGPYPGSLVSPVQSGPTSSGTTVKPPDTVNPYTETSVGGFIEGVFPGTSPTLTSSPFGLSQYKESVNHRQVESPCVHELIYTRTRPLLT